MEVSLRPKRQPKKISRSDDFLDNYDAELEAIESLPSTSVRPFMAHHEGGPRKRGRPRKYPVALPPPTDEQPIKRPRGRPKGSGKHQKAAAAQGSGLYGSAYMTESGYTNSYAVSQAPSDDDATGGGGATHRLALPASHQPLTATPRNPGPAVETKENGSITPHYPPRGNPSPATDSDASPAPAHGATAATATTTGFGRYPHPKPPSSASRPVKMETVDGFNFPQASSKLLPAETPTPKPRNRRKCAAPTKTE
ncbi:hypothetical protein Ndes2526B_g05354 [Nannochloris sp. 'desiccata']